MNRPTLYLGGPLTGITWGEALGWRYKVTVHLSNKYDILNPIKGQFEGQSTTDIIKASRFRDEGLPLQFTATAITAQDLFYIDQSDWILFNYGGAKEASRGSLLEHGYGRAMHKRIISIIESGSIHDYPMIRRMSDIFVPSLDEAIEFLGKI